MAAMAHTVDERKIGRTDWIWVGFWAVVIMTLTSLPYLLGAWLSTPDHQFGGFVIGVEDGNSYLAKMRQGATGGWRFYLPYTSEPHEGAYIYLFYILLGKLAGLSRLPLAVVYHLARVVCGMALLITVYRFTSFFTNLRPVQRLAFWLVGVGSGLGWLVVLPGLGIHLGMPLDFYSPDAFVFHLLFGLPHLALAEALLLWAILFLGTAWEKHRVSYALMAGLAWLGVAAIAPFYMLVAAAVITTAWLLRRWRSSQHPTHPWTEARLTFLAFAISLPILGYNIYLYVTNPIFRVWAEQDRILSPAAVYYLLAFGPLALLAIIGGWDQWNQPADNLVRSKGTDRFRWKGRSLRSRLLIGWCVIVPILVYIPFNLQRRMTLGVQIPLSILAALGLWRLSGAEGDLRRWRVVSTGLVALLSISNLMILAGALLEVSRQSPPLFHTGAEVSAADWLGKHASANQVVLAAYETGNYLPTRMAARVFIGHGSETLQSEAKRVMLRQFFSHGAGNSADDTMRRRLLQDHGIVYIFYGPAERSLGSFSPEDVTYLHEVYDNGVVQIYQVVDRVDD